MCLITRGKSAVRESQAGERYSSGRPNVCLQRVDSSSGLIYLFKAQWMSSLCSGQQSGIEYGDCQILQLGTTQGFPHDVAINLEIPAFLLKCKSTCKGSAEVSATAWGSISMDSEPPRAYCGTRSKSLQTWQLE